MTGEHVPIATEPHDPEPRRRAARAGGPPPLADLERLRDAIKDRLDQIEALARERLAAPPAAPSDDATELERGLLRKVADLEEDNERLRTEEDRREQEWRAMIEQLEEDRRLLADAWDRLEGERIEGHAEATAPRASRPAPADRPAEPPVRSGISGTPDDSVTQTILEQFHLLRNDVRRTANRRNKR
jgi:hypothetical protein